MIVTQRKLDLFHNAFGRWHMLVLCMVLSLTGMAQEKPPPGNHLPISTQVTDSAASKILSFPDRLFKKIDGRINNFDRQVTRRTDKALGRIIKQEERLKQMMAKGDSLATHNLFTRGIDSLKHFQQAITSKAKKTIRPLFPQGRILPLPGYP